MNWIDFFTGWFLMNAMPHFVFGVWHQRVLSLFGFGDKQNIFYAAFNTSVSLGLFHWNHGIENLLDHGIYLGCLAILFIYYVVGKFVRDLWA